MIVEYVFAGLVVADIDKGVSFYERFFGRPLDVIPKALEAVWRLAPTASLYLLADPARAGGGVATIVVGDLDAQFSGLAARGIGTSPIEDIPRAGRKASVTDPDGNAVSLVEVFPGT